MLTDDENWQERRDAIKEKSCSVYVYLHLLCHLFIIVYWY